MIRILLLTSLLLTGCTPPPAQCCRERDTIAATLKTVEQERDDARRMLQELQASLLDAGEPNKTQPK